MVRKKRDGWQPVLCLSCRMQGNDNRRVNFEMAWEALMICESASSFKTGGGGPEKKGPTSKSPLDASHSSRELPVLNTVPSNASRLAQKHLSHYLTSNMNSPEPKRVLTQQQQVNSAISNIPPAGLSPFVSSTMQYPQAG
jgi:hypothetical protein